MINYINKYKILKLFIFNFRADKKIKHCRIKLEGRLYTIGNVEFESLVELINYYETHPLYRRVKLSYPISEEAVKKMAMVSFKVLLEKPILDIFFCTFNCTKPTPLLFY